jgi:alpha-tubulin suppressor-like RCC1 family protein
VAHVVVTPALDTLTYFQETVQLKAVAVDTDGDSIPGKTFIWRSAAPGAVRVDSLTGVALAMGNGPIVITATALPDSVAGTATVVVSQVPTRLVFDLQPSATVERIPFQPPVLVDELDAHGSLVLRSGGTVTLRLLPNATGARVVAPTAFASAGIANFQSVAVDKAGTGYRFVAELGSVSSDTSAPFDITPNLTYVSLSSRITHSCAVTTTGNAYCWGLNASGQVGNGTASAFSYQLTPSQVVRPAGVSFISITTGTNHSCALAASGAGYCWGSDQSGQLGTGISFAQQLTPALVAAPAGVHFTAIEAGANHTCALTTSDLYCWGDDAFGEVGNGATGTFVGSPTLVSTPTGVTFSAIGLGVFHSCALSTQGAVYCWGRNDQGQLGDGTLTNHPTPVSVSIPETVIGIGIGTFHNCALGSSRTVYCWGGNASGEIGDGTRSASRPPTAVLGLPPIAFTQVIAGSQHSCAFASTATYCWGADAFGELGDGATNLLRLTPVAMAIPEGLHFVSLVPGNLRTCGLTDIGGAYCWGVNDGGTFGDGTFTEHATPTPVRPPQ